MAPSNTYDGDLAQDSFTDLFLVCHDAALVLDDRGIEVVLRRELLGAALEH